MLIRVKTREGLRIRIPIPTSLVGGAIRLVPERALRSAREQVPPPYDMLISKKAILLIYEAFKDMFHEYKGLEIIHVEAKDGTFVSIRL